MDTVITLCESRNASKLATLHQHIGQLFYDNQKQYLEPPGYEMKEINNKQ